MRGSEAPRGRDAKGLVRGERETTEEIDSMTRNQLGFNVDRSTPEHDRHFSLINATYALKFG